MTDIVAVSGWNWKVMASGAAPGVLHITLLGAPQVLVDGQSLDVDTRKAVALLAILALNGAPQSRDTLCALLWPESDATRARTALRRTLSTLNRALSNRWLVIERDAVGLDVNKSVWIDVRAFRSAGTRPGRDEIERLRNAAALYRGDLMDGFGLRDSPEFDDWLYLQREQLRREAAAVLKQFAQRLHAVGQFTDAIDVAHRWLALDALNEPAHRALMLAYVAAGDRPAALRQYRDCVRILDAELGVAPAEESTTLYQSIRASATPAPAQAAALPDQAQATSPLLPVTLPLVGRDRELELLTAQYAIARKRGRLVAIEGEMGLGKTRLATEFIERTSRNGSVALGTRCYEGEADLAYAPWSALLNQALTHAGDRLTRVDAHARGEAARLVPSFAVTQHAPPMESPGAVARFYDGVGSVLSETLRGESPGVLFIDDAHWLDGASLDLLAYVARRLEDRPLLILVTLRSELLAGDHRLRQLLHELERTQLGTTIELARLEARHVRQIVQEASIPQQTGQFSARLFEESEGLPLLIAEFINALHGDDAVTGDAWPLPESAQELLQSRLAGLREIESQMLTTASVIGRSFDFDTLREVSGRSEEEALTALETLLARGLIIERSEGAEAPQWDFTHDKIRQLVYQEMTATRRRLLHRRVAETLVMRTTARGTILPLASQIAQHFQLAGLDTQAGEHYELAGEYARRLFANAEAIAHFRAALALGHPRPETLHTAIGDLQTLRGDYAAALASYETAAALSQQDDLPALEHTLGRLYHRLGDWSQAADHYQSSVSALSARDEPGLRVRDYADWSLTAYRQGDPEGARALATDALALATSMDDQYAIAQSLNILGILHRHAGDLSTARWHLAESVRLATELDDYALRAASLNNMALICFAQGAAAEAIDLASAALELCLVQGDRHREAAVLSNLADFHQFSGHPAEAMDYLTRSVSIYAEIGVVDGEHQPEVWKLVEW